MRKKESGQITIFLGLILMVLISFLCTAVRSAQMAGSRYLFTLATEAATKSAFGAYDTRLWEQYRILALTDQKLLREIGEQCGDSYEQNGTWFPLEISSVELEKTVMVTDNGAQGWENAAIEYMEVRLPADVVSGLLEQAGLLEGLEQMTEWMAHFRDLFQPVIRLERQLCQLEDKLEQAIETYKRGKALLGELQACCTTLLQLLEQGDAMDPTASREAWASLEKNYGSIQKYLRDSGWELEELQEDTSKHLQSANSLAEQVQALMELLTGEEDGGLSALADLGGYLSGLTDRISFLQGLPQQLAQQSDFLQRVSQMQLPDKKEILGGVGQEAVGFLQGLAEGFLEEVWQPSQIEIEDGTEEDEQKAGLLVQLREWLDQGVLALVLEKGDTVSQAKLGRALERTERQDPTGVGESVYRSVLYGEYALRYTSSYGQNGGGGLQYETEHLVAGKGEDRANLAAVASRLLLLRGTLNFLYLLQHAGDNETVQLAAAGISAALGGWIPRGFMTVLLMVVWAMAEAVCDVRALLAGRQVPFWKDAASWKLAFEHLWTLLDQGFLVGMDRPEGMRYEEYLRLFLLVIPTEEKCYRTMEVAEENLRQSRSNFRVDQAVWRGTITVKGCAAGQLTQLSLEYGY